jgi:methylated-DNA-protein-cysteine methyltransferase related protein
MPDKAFRDRVIEIMRNVPCGMVTTYGDIAAYAGHPYAARVVGGIAHFGDENIPWHRLVNRFGGMASGFPGGRDFQARLLAEEGIIIENNIIKDFCLKRWRMI